MLTQLAPAQWRNSLPELYDGRASFGQLQAGEVGGGGGIGQAAVLTVAVVEEVNTARRVPFIITGGPGQDGVKGLDQVVEAPDQHHDVVGVTEKYNHHGGIAQT